MRKIGMGAVIDFFSRAYEPEDYSEDERPVSPAPPEDRRAKSRGRFATRRAAHA